MNLIRDFWNVFPLFLVKRPLVCNHSYSQLLDKALKITMAKMEYWFLLARQALLLLALFLSLLTILWSLVAQILTCDDF